MLRGWLIAGYLMPIPISPIAATAGAPYTQLVSPNVPPVDTNPSSQSMGFPRENFLEEQFIGPAAMLVKPRQNKKVFLAGDGRLYQKHGHKAEYSYVGHVQPDGQFQLVTGYKGSLFHNPVLRFSPYSLGGPLGKALQSVQDGILQRSSETSHIRQNLTSRGIDGRGTRMFFIEPGLKDIKGRFHAMDHTRLVRATVNDPAHGYAPGVEGQTAVFLVEESNLQLNPKLDTPETAQIKFITDMANSLYRVAALVDSAVQSPPQPQQAGQPAKRQIINMSIGLNPLVMAEIMYTVLEDKTPEGGYQFEAVRQAMYGPTHKDLKQVDKLNTLIQKSVNWFQNDPRIQQGYQHYQQAVARATQAGIPVVVAAGNEQNTFPTETNIPPIARFNWLALPDDVICVAASNNNQTPGNVADDTISDFSNTGDTTVKQPTVAATGEDVYLGKFYSGVAPGGAASGTSFATPIVAATVAMLFQLAPQLSVQQAKGVLQQAAYRGQTTPAQAGAGIIDPVAAINTLQQSMMLPPAPPAPFMAMA